MNVVETLMREVEELRRRLNNVVREGRVEEADAKKGYRIAIGDGDDGPIKTTWVKRDESGGSLKTWAPLTKGQKVKLFSPNGEIGGNSLVVPHHYNEGHDQPSENLEEPLFQAGGVTMRFSNGVLTIEGNLLIKGASVKHDDKDIGKTHKHGQVQPGGGQSGAPV